MHLLSREPKAVSDTEIVQLLRSQNPLGLQKLLEQHAGRTRWQLRNEFGKVLNVEDVDGIINQAAYQAWKGVSTFDANRGGLGAWFFVIARNLARAELRKDQGKPRPVDGLDLADVAPEQGAAVGYSASGSAAAGHGVAATEESGAPDDAGKAGSTAPEGGGAKKTGRYTAGLRACIEKLPRLQRLIMLADLRTGDVADAAQLAAEFNTTTNSIYVSRSNARKAVKKGLQQMGLFVGEAGASSRQERAE